MGRIPWPDTTCLTPKQKAAHKAKMTAPQDFTVDWNDRKQVQVLLNLAIAIQAKLWVEFDANNNRSIVVGNVFPAPVFHAGIGAKAIMFSININGLVAFEILVLRYSDTGRIGVILHDGEHAVNLATIDKMDSHISFAGMETLIEGTRDIITSRGADYMKSANPPAPEPATLEGR